MGGERAMKWAKSPSPDRIVRGIEEHEVWVGELDGAVIGWVEIDGDRLRGMYVRPDLSGRGLPHCWPMPRRASPVTATERCISPQVGTPSCSTFGTATKHWPTAPWSST